MSKVVQKLFCMLLVISYPLSGFADAFSGAISQLKIEQRTFVLQDVRYYLPTTIPIKYPDIPDSFFTFEELTNGNFLQVRATKGDGETKTVIEAFILPQ